MIRPVCMPQRQLLAEGCSPSNLSGYSLGGLTAGSGLGSDMIGRSVEVPGGAGCLGHLMAGEDGPGDDVRVMAPHLDPAEHRIWLAVIYDDSLAAARNVSDGDEADGM